MNDSEPIIFPLSRRKTNGAGRGGGQAPMVSFTRHELNLILRLYGLHVAAGEWRDYAIDMQEDRAVFSIFRHASEFPLYRIEKIPALARRQGAWRILAPSGQIIRRGHDLEKVLRAIAFRPRPGLACIK